MSYILEALAKEEKAKHSQGELPSVHSQQVVTSTTGQQQSIAWGILLTIAIFAALLAGFWLGQQNNASPDLPTAEISSQASPQERKERRTNTQAAESAKPLAKSPEQSSIAAEAYFESPPVKEAVPNKPAKEKAEKVAVTQLKISETATGNEQPKSAGDIEFDISAIEGVSDELLSRFQSAIDESSLSPEPEESVENPPVEALVSLAEMPDWVQNAVPQLQFDMHIYASDGQGWIRVNGEDKYEGDYISDDLLLEAILPQQVVLNFRGERFTLPALTNWSG